MFINLLRIAIIFFTFGTVDILDSYTLHSIDNIVYEGLSLRHIAENYLDVEIAELNNHTLKEVFEEGNEFNGIYITSPNASYDVEEIILAHNNDNNVYVGYNLKNVIPIGSNIYIRHEIVSNTLNENLFTGGYTGSSPFMSSYTIYVAGQEGISSAVYITDREALAPNRMIIFHSATSGVVTLKNNICFVNIDTLGISPSTDMDYYYLLYQTYNDVYVGDKIITFTTAPTQTQLDGWLSDYLKYKDNTSFEYTFKTLGIEHLILFTTSMLFWYYSLKLLRKAVK